MCSKDYWCPDIYFQVLWPTCPWKLMLTFFSDDILASDYYGTLGHSFGKVSIAMVNHGQVHKTRMAFACLSLVNFLHLARPQWWSHIQVLSERCWDQLAVSAMAIVRGELAHFKGFSCQIPRDFVQHKVINGACQMVLVVNAGDVRDAGSIPGLGRSRYSSMENSMDRGAWWATVHGIAKSWT